MIPIFANRVKVNRLTYTPIIQVRTPYPFPKKDFSGIGYLAGEFPKGITTIDGVPASLNVRVLWRDPDRTDSDGTVVASIQSAQDGTWRVSNLNADLRYDVLVRGVGFNDVIMSNITPAID